MAIKITDKEIDRICAELQKLKGNLTLRDVDFVRGTREAPDDGYSRRLEPDGTLTVTLRFKEIK